MQKTLKEIRMAKGCSIETLSYLTGLSITYLEKLENGIKDNPSLDIAEKISNALDMDIIEVCNAIIMNIKK